MPCSLFASTTASTTTSACLNSTNTDFSSFHSLGHLPLPPPLLLFISITIHSFYYCTTQLPPFYTLIIRTLTILEGLALSVDPKFRLVKGAYPFIAKQILSNQGKTASSPAKQILSNQGKTASSPLKSAAYTEEREMEREREWEREGERSGRGRGSGSAADRMAWSAGLGAASAEGLEASAEMNKLLTSIMINKNTGRIRWDKLERFVSISANADKALAGTLK